MTDDAKHRHAVDGWCSDEAFRSMGRNQEAYKRKCKEVEKLKKENEKLKDENAELKEQVENYPQSAEGYEDEEILEMIELKEEWDINIEPLCIGDCSQLATEINDRNDEIEELQEKITKLKKKLSSD